MTAPTRREALAALRDPDAEVVAFTDADGRFEPVYDEKAIYAAFADPERSVGIMRGAGWRSFAHLMDPRHRHLAEQPTPEREGDGTRGWREAHGSGPYEVDIDAPPWDPRYWRGGR